MKLRRNKKAAERREYILSDKSSFLMKEDYKALRTNLLFSFTDEGAKVIAVTSSGRGEGKSTNSLNTAISCAQLGKKVLLVECDLRLPSLSAKLKTKTYGTAGLSDVLVGAVNLKDAIMVNQQYGISFLFAGTIPPDPTRLLQSARMRAMIDALKSVYDYIILDCPPINAVVDSVLMSDFVDGYLMVVKHESTDQHDLGVAITKLQRAKANIVGVVYTNVPVHSKGGYGKSEYYYGKD